MFERAILDDAIKTRRKSSTVASFILQVMLVGVIVLIPLIFTQALPLKEMTKTMLVAPPPPPPPPPPPSASAPHPVEPVKSEIQETGRLITPTKVPKQVAMIKESAAPPPVAGVAGGVPGGVAGGQLGGVIGGVVGAVPTAAPKLAPSTQRVHVSQGVTEGLLVHKVVPEYPAIAKQEHVEGAVQLEAVIGKDGSVKNVKAQGGNPLLVRAAMDAVKQWKYKPYILNGQPVEVDTNITVNFKLS